MHNIDIIPQKILLIQQRQLGDVLLATHALAKLKEKFPNAQIDFLTEKKCEQILENNSCLADIYYIDKKKDNSFFKQIAFYRNISKNKYDLVISFQNLPRCLLQVFFTKAKYKLGLKNTFFVNPFYNSKKNKSALAIKIENMVYNLFFYTHMSTQISHFSGAKKLDALAPLGISPNERAKPYWNFTQHELDEARKILEEHNCTSENLLITMDVTTNKDSRRYPKEYYARIVHAIHEKYPQAKFLFFRAPSEEKEVAEYIELTKDTNAVILPNPCPSIRISAALMSYASYHVGNCSFPRHLAVALDIPSTILIGAGEPIWDYPDDKFYRFRALVQEIPNDSEYLKQNEFIWLAPNKEISKILAHIEEYRVKIK